MKSRQELIEDYQNNKKLKDREHKEEQTKRKAKEAETEKIVSSILASVGITLSQTNGYVYHFDFNGLRYTLCDQTNRTVGEVHIIPETLEDVKFIKEHGFLMGDSKENLELQKAFKYEFICINAPISSAIKSIIGE